MLVALVVIGPERLPGLARKVGLYVGKAQRMISSVKDEVNKEIAADQLKKHMADQAGGDDEFDFINEAKKSLNEVKDSLNEVVDIDRPRSSASSTSFEDDVAAADGVDIDSSPEDKTSASAEKTLNS